jgi:hemolysin III
MLTAVWSIAFLGLIFKLFYTGRYEVLSLSMYLGMGWLVLFDFNSIWLLFSPAALSYLVLGGLFYTVGVYFYRLKGFKESHAIWHVFVLGGATSHAFMIQELLLLR